MSAKNGNGKDPKGMRLYTSLRSDIFNGKLKLGDCLPSARELQQEYSISYRATLVALDRLKEEGLVERKQGSGTFVAEVPGRIGSDGQGKTVRVVTAFESHFSQLFLTPLVDAVQEELDRFGCCHSVAVLRKEDECDNEEWISRIQEAAEVGDADVVLQIHPSQYLLTLPPKRPTVFVAQDMETIWAEAKGYDTVTVDAQQSGVVAARYLKEIGCKRVVKVGVFFEKERMWSPYSYLRFRGFEWEWGSPIPESMTFPVDRYTPACGAEVVSRILALDPLPDAIFTDTDDLAHGLCHALLAHGIKPGKEIKVIGCDGQPPLYPQDPLLTTVAAPLPELGKTAVRLALQRAENPDGVAHRVLLTGTLRKGDTA